MKTTTKAMTLLEEMKKIERMERGTVCKMKGREHFNHQTWQNGRNLVRYVPRGEVEDLQIAIQGYDQFRRLAEQYADEIIRITRREHARKHPKKIRRATTPPAQAKNIAQKVEN